ncbi:MAG: Ig-like domain-containing protein [Flavobacteriales bacterium]|nr:Ig-like domain-containing protein [Flavobacteriales bacterium]
MKIGSRFSFQPRHCEERSNLLAEIASFLAMTLRAVVSSSDRSKAEIVSRTDFSKPFSIAPLQLIAVRGNHTPTYQQHWFMVSFIPFLFFLLYGCAQIVTPTGGDKDITPPEILSEEPPNHTVNFNAEKLVISFDEYIQLNQPSEQIIISPPMLPNPGYTLKRKSLVVTFESELKPNTTYTINFGEAIKDNNEGNILKNYTYVFSTGTKLDSMAVKGKLIDAVTGAPVEDALVMLYKNDVDSLPLDTIPDYFTRTSAEGEFEIEHVADQPYRIFALKDQNNNYRFDIPDEDIAFLDSMILPIVERGSEGHDPISSDSLALDTISETLAANDSLVVDSLKAQEEPGLFYNLRMFVQEDTTQFLKRAFSEHYGKLVFVYNLPIKRFSAKVDGLSFKKQWAIKEYGIARDTVILWTTDVVPDTMLILSSVDGFATDTTEITMKARTNKSTGLKKKGKGLRKVGGVFALSLKTNPPNKRSPKSNQPLTLIWSHPILNMDLEKVTLMEDSIRVKYQLSSSDTALRRFDLNYPWKTDAQYDLHIQDSAFTDLFNLWNDTIDVSFVGSDKESFGELSLKITEEPTEQIVVELLNGSGTVLQKQVANSANVIMFTQLDPGKYDIRVIRDLNGNGKWDAGRYAEHLQPESIKIIQRETEVRANWNMELEWNPNESNAEK